MTKKTPAKNPAAQALGRLGGSAGTAKQNAARAVNAQRAGRPRRVCNHCSSPVIGGHADRDLDDTCGRHGWHWERAGTPHTPPVSVDRVALDQIAVAFGTAGSNDAKLLAEVRAIVRASGRRVRGKS